MVNTSHSTNGIDAGVKIRPSEDELKQVRFSLARFTEMLTV